MALTKIGQTAFNNIFGGGLNTFGAQDYIDWSGNTRSQSYSTVYSLVTDNYNIGYLTDRAWYVGTGLLTAQDGTPYALDNASLGVSVYRANNSAVGDNYSIAHMTITNNTDSPITYTHIGLKTDGTRQNWGVFLVAYYELTAPVIIPANSSRTIDVTFNTANV